MRLEHHLVGGYVRYISPHIIIIITILHWQTVGCDFQINSNAVEDRCGVCHGDGSSCETVKDQLIKQSGFGKKEQIHDGCFCKTRA